jgi:ribosome-associated protein
VTPRLRAARIAAAIAERATWGFSRSSGPGGQRRDHAETRAELTVRREDLAGLSERDTARLVAGLHLDTRPLRLTSQAERSRERNREIVLERLERRVADALAPAPPSRRPTRPSRASKERRLAAKTRRSRIKSGRRSPPEEG